MSINCPDGGKVIYLDCLECENKTCKRPKYKEQKEEYLNNFLPETQKIAGKQYDKNYKQLKRSKIFQTLMRSDTQYVSNNVNFIENCGGDVPGDICGIIAYTCCLFINNNYHRYEIYYESGAKRIQVYKSKWINGNSYSIGYYYYCSPNTEFFFCNHFDKDNFKERISNEELTRLANKDWMEFYDVTQNKTNYELLRLFKIKFLHVLMLDDIIEWCEYKKKYIEKGYSCMNCVKYYKDKYKCNRNKVMIHKHDEI